MDFKKYPSIENTYRKKTLDYLIAQGLTKGEFVVQEKAHGANFSFWYDGNELKSGKRTGFITDDFYDYKPVEEKCQDKVKQLYSLLKQMDYDVDVLIIYGELIGGTYPHQDVKKDTSATRIQKGIFYSPHNEFYAIDVSVNEMLLDIDTFTRVMEKTGFLFARTIFSGTFEECLNYPNTFSSQISVWAGFHQIEDNVCEGIVIKPATPLFFSDNSRVILKNKNEKWAEKARKTDRVKKKAPALSESCNKLCNDIENFITENRLHNVLSKTGSIAQKEFGKLIHLFSQDILDDFYKDHLKAYKALEKKEQKQLTKQMNKSAAVLIRSNFQNIVDGNY